MISWGGGAYCRRAMNMMNGNPTRKGFLGVLVFLTAAPFTNASSEDSSSLFNLKEEINFAEACWCFLILLTATIIIETFTEWIEWVLQGKGHFLVIVNKVYKEVMILGLISFLLFCSEQGPLLDDLDHSWIISFEFAHILLFFIGISFCLLSVGGWVVQEATKINRQCLLCSFVIEI
ncbi:unnamed protein product [Heterosigma akashiwo]|mmetsp:Transcript_22628/g.35777  ORF Transcript_22628/g.35777 Transcript_22628/m.35777 type:complete len:177 (-) Transcript_22628:9-539(-)